MSELGNRKGSRPAPPSICVSNHLCVGNTTQLGWPLVLKSRMRCMGQGIWLTFVWAKEVRKDFLTKAGF